MILCERKKVKKDIHPNFEIKEVACSTCSTKHAFGTTATKLNVDVCSSCHAFYTGDRSKVKSTGRIERFNRRAAAKQQ